ncbi:MAG: hypothetical protein U9N77_15470 [Thermodesulfobacteriota bacterium]|nr:hypothetical protein [Thermodesulfobacteriota bacterium]
MTITYTGSTANYIPNPTIFILFLSIIFTSVLLYPLKADGQSEIKIFYARFDIKYSNNTIEKSNLLIIPAENDFRAEKFTTMIISGHADYSTTNAKTDIKTRAKHNAVKALLEHHGLKSLKSKSSKINNFFHNETVMSYEGAVKLPCQIVDVTFDKKHGGCRIKIKIEFAATAFPDKWRILQIKQKIEQTIDDILSLFH